MMIEMETIVSDFACCLISVDSRAPRAVNTRSGKAFQAGIGPHGESETVKLVTEEMQARFQERYSGLLALSVPYPEQPRQKCDFCIGDGHEWDWAIEVKMIRFLGDNGKANDNILMHILSPYPADRSALTDCTKLSNSRIARCKAILIYGYEAAEWSLEPAIAAFEVLASSKVKLGSRTSSRFSGLVHPVHRGGAVYGWSLEGELGRR